LPSCDKHRHYASDYAAAVADGWICARLFGFTAPLDENVVGAAIEYLSENQ